MRILIQRVRRASVSIGGTLKSAIGPGLLVFVGIEAEDGEEDIEWLAGKLTRLRIFDDENGVSQFTLHASTRKGNRPSYIKAAPEAISRPLYERFAAGVGRALGREVATGEFGADMQVELVNDGPVTIWIDSRQRE